MVEIQVHSGTFHNYAIKYKPSEKTFYIPTEKHLFKGEPHSVGELVYIEEATEENISKVNSNITLNKAKSNISPASKWGAMFGIAGIVAEAAVKGGNITFIAEFKNDIKILATTDERTYKNILENFSKLSV